MNKNIINGQIACAYLYTISKYGYPPDIRRTSDHIREMAALGFTSIELEGIGRENIHYLFQHKKQVADILAMHGCSLPVLCIVLPRLGSAHSGGEAEDLELFEMGCELAKDLGAGGVLDNGPWLPLEYPVDAPVVRHYSEEHLSALGLPKGFIWSDYWQHLTSTYRKASETAAKYGLVYHMHPCEGSLITGTDAFINFAEAVGSPNLFFNLDTANQFYLKDNLPLSVLRLADRISYIHISDNTGIRPGHLVPGDGNISWDGFFSALHAIKFKGTFAIDVGGAETVIQNIDEAYSRSVAWLEEQLNRFSLNNKINAVH